MKKTIQDGFNTIGVREEQSRQGGSGKGILLAVILVLLFLILLLVAIRMDVGGFGSKVLRPMLKDVPLVRVILPPESDEEAAKRTGYHSLSQAVARIDELEEQIETLKEQQNTAAQDTAASADASSAQAKIDELTQQVAALKVYEDNQKTFESTKEQFYKEVVYNDKVDLDSYTKWYESMDADTAAKLYKEAVQTQAVSDKEKELADSYSKMKPEEAASILNTMTGDVDTVAAILSAMNARYRGEIMGKMDPAFAAKITKKLTQ